MRNKVPLYLINKYQKATENKEHRCRYFPSCSQYAKECYEKFGFIKREDAGLGSGMILKDFEE